jgi:hypothetical protein
MLNIVIEMFESCLEKGQDINDWWCEEYLKIKSNYLELILNEGEEFDDKSCF